MAKRGNNGTDGTVNLGFEAKLWLAADKLRNNMDELRAACGNTGIVRRSYAKR